MLSDLGISAWADLWDNQTVVFWGPILISLVVGAIGMVIGIFIELTHFWSLGRREKALVDFVTSPSRTIPQGARNVGLVTGTVALSEDTFRGLFIRFRKIFGGRIRRYEKLMRRARREARLRMASAARLQGADMVMSVRYETSNIASSSNGSITAMEVIAYGTAIDSRNRVSA